MIYITSDTTSLIIPKVMTGDVTQLTLTHQVSHQVTTIDVEDDTPDKNYYTFATGAIFSDMADGQYDYRVIGENGVTAQGIAQIGDYDRDMTENSSTLNITQYNG